MGVCRVNCVGILGHGVQEFPPVDPAHGLRISASGLARLHKNSASGLARNRPQEAKNRPQDTKQPASGHQKSGPNQWKNRVVIWFASRHWHWHWHRLRCRPASPLARLHVVFISFISALLQGFLTGQACFCLYYFCHFFSDSASLLQTS